MAVIRHHQLGFQIRTLRSHRFHLWDKASCGHNGFGSRYLYSVENVLGFQLGSPRHEDDPCSHAAHCHQPPLGHSGQNQGQVISLLQATNLLKDVGSATGEVPQLPEAPLYFISLAIHPPKGWTWSSLALLLHLSPVVQDITCKVKLLR